jgi:hypothetical protein
MGARKACLVEEAMGWIVMRRGPQEMARDCLEEVKMSSSLTGSDEHDCEGDDKQLSRVGESELTIMIELIVEDGEVCGYLLPPCWGRKSAK